MARTAKRERQLRKEWERRTKREIGRAVLSVVPKRWEDGTPEEREAIESRDRFAAVRGQLRKLAEHAGEWAGIPIGIEGEQLVIEKSYPFAQVFNDDKSPDDPMEGWTIINRWWSAAKGGEIWIIEKNGKREWVRMPGVHHFDYDLSTLGCSFAWGIEQESRAVQLLATLLRHHQFKCYMLTGSFLESSSRSGIAYMFRRLKPTVAITAKGRFRKLTGDRMSILACLCMHPIGYYSGSWAGAMCPTDDVIAHLQLMRGDEALYWKRCQQHPAYRPEAGL